MYGIDCRVTTPEGCSSSSSDDSKEISRSDVVARGLVFFGLRVRDRRAHEAANGALYTLSLAVEYLMANEGAITYNTDSFELRLRLRKQKKQISMLGPQA